MSINQILKYVTLPKHHIQIVLLVICLLSRLNPRECYEYLPDLPENYCDEFYIDLYDKSFWEGNSVSLLMSNDDCFDLSAEIYSEWYSKTKSIYTRGHCIIIYDKNDCTGNELFVHPWHKNWDNEGRSLHDQPRSFKSCNHIVMSNIKKYCETFTIEIYARKHYIGHPKSITLVNRPDSCLDMTEELAEWGNEFHSIRTEYHCVNIWLNSNCIGQPIKINATLGVEELNRMHLWRLLLHSERISFSACDFVQDYHDNSSNTLKNLLTSTKSTPSNYYSNVAQTENKSNLPVISKTSKRNDLENIKFRNFIEFTESLFYILEKEAFKKITMGKLFLVFSGVGKIEEILTVSFALSHITGLLLELIVKILRGKGTKDEIREFSYVLQIKTNIKQDNIIEILNNIHDIYDDSSPDKDSPENKDKFKSTTALTSETKTITSTQKYQTTTQCQCRCSTEDVYHENIESDTETDTKTNQDIPDSCFQININRFVNSEKQRKKRHVEYEIDIKPEFNKVQVNYTYYTSDDGIKIVYKLDALIKTNYKASGSDSWHNNKGITGRMGQLDAYGYAQSKFKTKTPRDHKGHLLAYSLGGRTDVANILNLAPQSVFVNTISGFKPHELEWSTQETNVKKWLDVNKENCNYFVFYQVELEYDLTISKRPIAFNLTHSFYKALSHNEFKLEDKFGPERYSNEFECEQK